MSVDRSAFVAYGVEITGDFDYLEEVEDQLDSGLGCRYAGDWMGCGKDPSLIVFRKGDVVDLEEESAGAYELPSKEPAEILGKKCKWIACYCVS